MTDLLHPYANTTPVPVTSVIHHRPAHARHGASSPGGSSGLKLQSTESAPRDTWQPGGVPESLVNAPVDTPSQYTPSDIDAAISTGRLLVSRGGQAAANKVMGVAGRELLALYQKLPAVADGTRAEQASYSVQVQSAIAALRQSRVDDGSHRYSVAARNAMFAQKQRIATVVRSASWRSQQPALELAALIVEAAADLGLHLQAKLHDDSPPRLHVKTQRQVELDRIRQLDPDAHAAVTFQRSTYSEINKRVRERIEQGGLHWSMRRILGRLVHVGEDPMTSETFVFDLDGTRLATDTFTAQRHADLRQRARLSPPPVTEVPLKQLHSVTDTVIATLSGTPQYVSITDDSARSGQLTRIYETRWHDGRRLVIRGRFRGIYLDDLINSEGRLIEGTSYTYNERTDRSGAHPVRYDPGIREVYVTVAEVRQGAETTKRLYLSLPYFQGHWTELRRSMRSLSKHLPSVQYVEGSKNTAFYFDAEDYAQVRDAVGGLALSKTALRMLQSHFETLVHADRATDSTRLAPYTAAAIGGFRPVLDGVPTRLLSKQKQALAWLEAHGNRGVCALDTGMGKTLTAIAMMQKFVRDLGDTADDGKGRFLYVCPPALRGNIIKEMHRFLTPEATSSLLARLDIMSYGQMRRAVESQSFRHKAWSGEQYAAVFFDEAQALKNDRSKTCRAAMRLTNAHKICLTASPLEKHILEAYVLHAISNNIDLHHPQPSVRRALRRKMFKFRDLYTHSFGGRCVGVTDNVTRRQALHTWTKRNIFYADKTDVEEFELPSLSRETVAVEMSPEVEKAYRSTAWRLRGAMKSLVVLLRDRGMLIAGVDADGEQVLRVSPRARHKEMRQIFGIKFREIIDQLNMLANHPEHLVPGAGSPKLTAAARIFGQRLHTSGHESRALLFSDDKSLLAESAQHMSKKFPGKLHAAAESNRIRLFKNGTELTHYLPEVSLGGRNAARPIELPFRPRSYLGRPRSQWRTTVLQEFLGSDDQVATMTLHGQIYNHGQNLQAFDTVVHLDRDSWNSEDMKQRTARAWRQGQRNPVHEYTLDSTYAHSDETPDILYSDADKTLDDIRRYHQVLEGELFDAVIKDAQGTELGREWFVETPRQLASLHHTDAKTLLLMASPYVTRSRKTKWRNHVRRAS